MSEPNPAPPLTGQRLGVARCHVCSALCRTDGEPMTQDAEHPEAVTSAQPAPVPPPVTLEEHPPPTVACPRCGSTVHMRVPDSLSRTTALLVSAGVLYIPANLLPVMHTESLLGAQDETIMSGVLHLLHSGSWPLALVVFVASIVVPMLKLLALGLLVVSTGRGSVWRPVQRTLLYRLVEAIGRWSMLDIYVITILIGLVQFRALASVLPGTGALAFAAVVVLTMLASQSFDPRLIWDASQAHDPHE